MTIEEHLRSLGLDPDRLTDTDRLEVARVMVDAHTYGTGYLERHGGLFRLDPGEVFLSSYEVGT